MYLTNQSSRVAVEFDPDVRPADDLMLDAYDIMFYPDTDLNAGKPVFNLTLQAIQAVSMRLNVSDSEARRLVNEVIEESEALGHPRHYSKV